VDKIAKKQSEGVHLCKFGTQNRVRYCQKYTHTDCFFGDLSPVDILVVINYFLQKLIFFGKKR